MFGRRFLFVEWSGLAVVILSLRLSVCNLVHYTWMSPSRILFMLNAFLGPHLFLGLCAHALLIFFTWISSLMVEFITFGQILAKFLHQNGGRIMCYFV